MTTSPTKGFCAASAWPLYTVTKKKKTSKKQESQLSRRHLALSANPTVHRQGGLYRHWSAVPQLGHCGSKPKVKGRTAVRSAGRWKTHLPTYIIENPPTVIAQTLLPLSLSSVSSKAFPNRTTQCVVSTFVALPEISRLKLQILFLFAKLDKFINKWSIALSSGSSKMLEYSSKKAHNCPQQATCRFLSNDVSKHYRGSSLWGSCTI